jgi:xanthine dehydrogenase accessory factor
MSSNTHKICPDFQPHAEAVLVKAHHAAPLPPGARIWVDSHGAYAGAISMGCVDHDVAERLRLLLSGNQPNSVIQYAEGNEFTGEVGLTCGGRIDILLRRIPDADPVYTALAALVDADAYTLVTVLTGPQAGQQRLYRTGHPPIGSLGSPTADETIDNRIAAGVIRAGTHEEADATYLFEPHEPAPNMLLVGASAIAAHLCHCAALTGFTVHLVDPRRELARADRFPLAASIQHTWPDTAFAELHVDANWYIAVLAHDLKLDTPALVEALQRNCRYVGLLGSDKTQQKHRQRLQEHGFGEDEWNRIHGPIGLDIEAVTPAEIAISILAQIIQIRHSAV